ncbi:MAG: multicopper oxidase family protein [Actinobacteria bacterium]|nr:multicopper oxidase family protein [Actinomycetota bacterium]
MQEMTRRQALILGAVGAGSVVTGAVGLSQTGLPWDQRSGPGRGPTPSGGGADLLQPTVLNSSDGLLEVELEMGRAEVTLGDRTARMLTYNGTVPGPTLRLRPGDTLRVRLANDIAEPTNLHVHGLHVSPEGNGDNPFLTIEPGETFDYEFTLPPDHPTGTFWYHPHHHGYVADQIFAGLYGAIIVEDGPPADSPADGERLLVISDISLTGEGKVRAASIRDRMMGREGEIVLVNGQVRPRIATTAGRTERWRVVNTCVSRHLRLDLTGAKVQLLGVDVDRHQPRDLGDLILAPGNRAELLVTADAGTSEFRTLGYDRGGMGMGMMGRGGRTSGSEGAAVVLATVEASEGGPANGSGRTDDSRPTDSSGRADDGGQAGAEDEGGAAAASSLPEQSLLRDLRDAEPAARRTISFTMGMGMGAGMSFGFNGREFDADRTDQDPAAGSVEEWTILNTTPMEHPFHLHVWPMQVVGANGSAVSEPYWRDVVQVPAGESRTVRIAFDTFSGRTVYHCHILDHEDAGMMGVVEVGE